jgi:hypothetical protein
MDTSEQINSTQKYDRFGIVSLILGLTTLVFPLISVVYLVTANGGPGYLQSLFCGIPIALLSIVVGTIALAQRAEHNRAGNWMATSGIVFGSLFFVISLAMVFVLIFPFLSGTAH